MRASSLPFRWRLTTWYGVLLSVSFLLIGAGLYVGLRSLLLDNFNEQVIKQSNLALANVSGAGDSLRLDPIMLATLQDDEHFVRLFANDGTLLLDTGAQSGTESPEAGTIEATLGGRTSRLTVDGHGERFAAIVSPVKAGDQVVGVLEVGLSRGDLDETLRLVAIVLGIAAPIVLVIAVAGGYVIAGKAIAPVADITGLAAKLDGSDLRARLNLRLPDDELGRLARTFDGMLERIEGAFERQRRFTGDAAHELRTPLTMMRSELDLALRSPKTADQYRVALEALDGDLERMTGLVSSLLTLARADARQVNLETAAFDLGTTVSVIAEQYGPVAAGQGIELLADVQPVVINGDQDRCIQILVNLLDNALVHTPAGGEIEIGVRQEGDFARCWVRDSGSGIAPEHVPFVFDRFYRVDTGRSRVAGGTGLGLSICRTIVDSMGGTIELASEPGRGTTVTVLLPVSAGASVSD